MDTLTAPGSSSAEQIVYRVAAVADVAELYRLLQEKFWPEHRVGNVRMSIDPVKAHAAILDKVVNGVVFIATVGAAVVGTLGTRQFSPWWTSEVVLADTWFYVAPEYRRARVARQLLRLGIEYAKEKALPLLIEVYNSHDAERKDKFFTRMGFETAGGWYVMNGG